MKELFETQKMGLGWSHTNDMPFFGILRANTDAIPVDEA